VSLRYWLCHYGTADVYCDVSEQIKGCMVDRYVYSDWAGELLTNKFYYAYNVHID